MPENRLIEIEIKLAYQEDLLHELNKIVAQQQKTIGNLETMCRILAERIDNVNSQQLKQSVVEIPPHY